MPPTRWRIWTAKNKQHDPPSFASGRNRSEEIELAGQRYSRRTRRWNELRCIEHVKPPALMHGATLYRLVKTLTNQIRPDALTTHARRKIRVVVFAAAHLADAIHHAIGAIGKMRQQPLLKQGIELPRQAQHGITGAMRTRVSSSRDDAFQFRFVDKGNNRCNADADRNTGIGQGTDH